MDMTLDAFSENKPCLYCGCPDAHECEGVPVCDRCCIDTTDIEIAYPKAKQFLQRIIDYRFLGRPERAPGCVRVSREDAFGQMWPGTNDPGD